MLKIFFAFSIALLAFSNVGCRSIYYHENLAQKRMELVEKEQWRYDIPKDEKAPVVPVFPRPKKVKLKNGLSIIVVEDNRLPIVEVGIVFKNGSSSDPIGLAGLNYLSAIMLKEGTKDMSSLELAEAFANLGTEVSVSLDKDMTHISSAVLSNKIQPCLGLISNMITHPRLSEEDFNRVKKQHMSGLSYQEGVLAYVAQTSFLKAIYGPDHPYAYPAQGTLRTLTKITLPEVKKAWKENFSPTNSALIAVGDVSLEQMKDLAENYFGTWQPVEQRPKKIPMPKSSDNMQVRLIERPGSPQTYLLLGQAVAAQNDSDLAALEVFSNILAGMPIISRLNANLREKRGWTYGVSSHVIPLLGKGPLMVATSIQVPFGSDALSEIMKEFESLKSHPVTEVELTQAKNGILNSFAARYSTIGKIAGSLANQFVYALPYNHDELYYHQVSQVSKKDITAVASRVLRKDHMVAVAVGELEAMSIPLAKMDVGKVIIEPSESTEGVDG